MNEMDPSKWMAAMIESSEAAMVAREAHGTIYTHAGPEIGVASTKAFTSQLTALFLFALHLAQKKGTVTDADSLALVEELSRLPGKIEELDAKLGELHTAMADPDFYKQPVTIR